MHEPGPLLTAGRRRWWPRLALLGLSLVLALVAAELLVRAWIGGDQLASFERRARRLARGMPDAAETLVGAAADYVLHPYRGYAMDPGGGPPADLDDPTFAIDALGFPLRRGRPAADAAASFRVGLTGGSVAMALALERGESLARALAGLPAVEGRPVAVRVLALGGYKQPQQVAALSQALLAGERFDLVINLDGFNEIALPWGRLREHGVEPSYPIHWPAMTAGVISDPDRLERLGALAAARARRVALARAYGGGPWRRLAVTALAWSVIDASARREVDRRAAAADDATSARRFETHGPPVPQLDEEAYLDRLADVWAEGSRQLAGLCRIHGIRYLHALQPNQYLPASKPLGAAERTLAINPARPHVESVPRGYPRLRERGRRLAAEGIAFVDLSDVFAAEEAAIYVDDCCHVNALGNQRIARRLAIAVGGVPAPGVYAPGSTESDERAGDEGAVSSPVAAARR